MLVGDSCIKQQKPLMRSRPWHPCTSIGRCSHMLSAPFAALYVSISSLTCRQENKTEQGSLQACCSVCLRKVDPDTPAEARMIAARTCSLSEIICRRVGEACSGQVDSAGRPQLGPACRRKNLSWFSPYFVVEFSNLLIHEFNDCEVFHGQAF